MQKLITEKGLAEITGLALQTLRNARHERKGIPYIRLGGDKRGAIRYDLQDVEAYIAKRRIDPEAVADSRPAQ
jgi:phage terminase Nu1 subunit (DNA packaging protein)